MRIELRAVSKSYLLKTALHDVNISFSPAKIHALFGENGSGKSMLAGILAGDIQPTSGAVLLDGTPVIFHSAKDARAKGIVATGRLRQWRMRGVRIRLSAARPKPPMHWSS